MRSAGDEGRATRKLLERALLLVFVVSVLAFFLWRELSDAAFDYGHGPIDAGTPAPVL